MKITQIMKYLRFFLISVVSILSDSEVFACWAPWVDMPRWNNMYRVYDNQPEPTLDIEGHYPGAGRNCEEWQELTSKAIPLEDIYQVVYQMTLEEFEAVYENRNAAYKNKFTEWITKKDTSILDFLLLAKNNEYIRLKRNSRWYYPSMNMGTGMTLEEVAEKALAEKDNRLRDRYLLQGVRALFSLSKYNECIELWETEISSLPDDNLMRQLVQPYIAGAEFHANRADKAVEYFAQIGDVQSMLFCMNRAGEEISTVDALELVCEHAPNSNFIEKALQSCVRKFESSWEFWREDEFVKTPAYEKLYALSIEMARGGNSNNPAMWYYTAAFLADLDGNAAKASYLLGQAESSKSTPYIDESIKVFRIYLDAKLLPYNSSYEDRLFAQLKWLDIKIQDNIDDHVRAETARGYIGDNYYWNGAMRRIVLSEVCPRMIKAGKKVRALQLANMADNRLFSLVNEWNLYDWVDDEYKVVKTYTMNGYRYSDRFNSLDYSNHFFEMIDSIGVDNAIQYVQRANRPQSDFDRFLNSRGYTGSDYLNDIAGTQCLRNMRYKEALEYLGKVSEAYKTHHNVYMEHDPFSADRKAIEQESDFRYGFAREMYSLEQSFNIVAEPNRKAQLMVKYALGIRNSFDLCWGLTQYYWGTTYWRQVCEKRDWESDDITKAALERAKELINLACDMVTDDEAGANIQYMLCNFKAVARNYPNTEKGRLVRGKCDNLCDHHAESCRWK